MGIASQGFAALSYKDASLRKRVAKYFGESGLTKVQAESTGQIVGWYVGGLLAHTARLDELTSVVPVLATTPPVSNKSQGCNRVRDDLVADNGFRPRGPGRYRPSVGN